MNSTFNFCDACYRPDHIKWMIKYLQIVLYSSIKRDLRPWPSAAAELCPLGDDVHQEVWGDGPEGGAAVLLSAQVRQYFGNTTFVLMKGRFIYFLYETDLFRRVLPSISVAIHLWIFKWYAMKECMFP